MSLSLSFDTITQFIDPDAENKKNSQLYRKNACCFFAVISASEFLKNKDLSKIKHEQNIYSAIANNILNQNNDMSFDQLVSNYTDLKKGDIMATTVELVETGELGYDLIFNNEDNNKLWVTIFLKNSKFFVVIYNNGIYAIRDCHESFQYNFGTKQELINHLNNIYQFNKPLVIDGYSIPEFSSIEYIKVYQTFNLKNLVINNNNDVNTNSDKYGFYIRKKKYYEDNEEIYDNTLEKNDLLNQTIAINKEYTHDNCINCDMTYLKQKYANFPNVIKSENNNYDKQTEKYIDGNIDYNDDQDDDLSIR